MEKEGTEQRENAGGREERNRAFPIEQGDLSESCKIKLKRHEGK